MAFQVLLMALRGDHGVTRLQGSHKTIIFNIFEVDHVKILYCPFFFIQEIILETIYLLKTTD